MPEPLRLAPFDVYIDPLLEFQDRRLRELLAYWQGKRLGRAMPARADVNPADIVSHLPSVFLIGAAPPACTPGDFYVRLMGTALNEMLADDYTGRTLAQGMPGKAASALAKVLGTICELRRPLRLYGHAAFLPDRIPAAIEAIVLPLSSNGTLVDMAMGELVRRASAHA